MFFSKKLKPFEGGGTNKMYRTSNWLIKHIDPKEVKFAGSHGSPHAEVNGAKLFDFLGVPHLGAEYVPGALPEFIRYRFRPELKNIGKIDPQDVEKHYNALRDPDRHGNIHLAEWLGVVGDRHGGNYAIDPELGLLSIDHGASFHPQTGFLNHQSKAIKDQASMSPLRNPDAPSRWSQSVGLSALNTLGHIHLGYPHGEYDKLVIPRSTIERALNHPDALVRFAHDGTQGLPDEERKFAIRAMKLRLDYLRSSYLSGHPVRIGRLHDLHRLIQDHVRSRGRKLEEEAMQEELHENSS